ncbi:MAG: hypothetical protein Q8Q09_26295 [Deltaproteobacteria bacterium]|nr:hypothetical protein [Deltaproteobacteria bacterium]
MVLFAYPTLGSLLALPITARADNVGFTVGMASLGTAVGVFAADAIFGLSGGGWAPFASAAVLGGIWFATWAGSGEFGLSTVLGPFYLLTGVIVANEVAAMMRARPTSAPTPTTPRPIAWLPGVRTSQGSFDLSISGVF